jgi:hypothetical protein
VTGTIADVNTALVTNYGTLQTSGAETVTISGTPVVTSATITQLNAIDASTTGKITATISGTAADLAGLTVTDPVTGNAYTVAVSDAATMAQLTHIDEGTTGFFTYDAGITDLVDNLLAHTPYISYSPVTITNPATMAQLVQIDDFMDGIPTYSTIHDTAANLLDKTGHLAFGDFTGYVYFNYIKSGTNIIVDGDITTNQLAALDVANGNGTVILASNTLLSMPNTYLIESADTPIWTVSGGMVAKVIDAPGNQVIHIAKGGKLSLTGSEGHNVVVFDAFQLGDLTVSRSGSTVIFSDKATPTPHQIASIAVTSFAPSQTIGFSDGTHVELTLTGTNYDVLKFDGNDIPSIL